MFNINLIYLKHLSKKYLVINKIETKNLINDLFKNNFTILLMRHIVKVKILDFFHQIEYY